jgi:two-component system sensor histidine kinase YesM
MALGYIIIVFLPVVISGYILYNQFQMNVMDDFSQGKQRHIIQASNSLEVSLTQVESIYSLFQYNSQLLEYLKGLYQTNGDYVYHFLKDIRPIFSFAYNGNDAIQSLRLYKIKNNVMPVSGEIEDLNAVTSQFVDEVSDNMLMNQGKWLPLRNISTSVIPQLAFYQKIYNQNYSDRLGVMEVIVNQEIIADFLETVDINGTTHALIVQNNEIIYQSEGVPITSELLHSMIHEVNQETSGNLVWKEKDLLVNSIDLKDLQVSFYFLTTTDEIFGNISEKAKNLAFAMFGLLIFLSIIYYAIASVLTKRILNLAKHMRRVDENNFTLYTGENHNDEIGFLTVSYNLMITRIEELLKKVNRAELMKKEADYLVLQAQIKPHFLYNTLESIRMLAEINDDEEVVEATYTFSKLLRYSLSSGGNETLLKEEIDNIRHYLEIHKLRMMDRLIYHINIDAYIDKIQCPRFILQPLVENCIHHGISQSRKQGKIHVHVQHKGAYLQIEISDNGAGIPEERLKTILGVLNNTLDRSMLQTNDSGLGLYNVSERVKAYFGEESRLEIESRQGEGTTYILKLKR